ncbi:MAG: GNAT family N-acetyltransferase [Candidatus Thiodiazotropha sp. (ex Lucinoma annulata)]|nr:GNAT family N-acetyltransferase [Candidatus Thiodiazotropha sp. (ex Lucinoma borealis)]MCU7840470.1 GNAT family N-acetyltransferase [Candidatus Thiodiazotropha sp. (ex Troendleina suluensis)]MCU7885833.1 GNAT family N-acetyltransferase [Candidatus Thiodiazotropha sp. (ex Lucinoma annulata)]MCU7857875.1 GNAT family N-acetyltransferase [Candidatus Thiodiazotropha sp. (ex Lucinoma borealis)]MCU7865674.1 GNAT family N-acetyltransferase [Candidatus Thiodiazotropha sp. (ex Lucinoma borealis)]
MIEHAVLETSRLLLRPLALSDTLAIQKTAGAREIADTMISLPHPYPAGGAERYVALQQAERDAGRSVTFTIKQKAEEEFCGLVEVRDIDRTHSQGELSFWLAVEAWGNGFMSEVVQAVVQYGFESLELNRLYAYHMLRNPASGRVLEKNGFKQEGLLRQRVRKWGQFEDVLLWANLRQEWQDELDK